MKAYLAHYDKEKGVKQELNVHLTSVAKLIYKLIPPTVRFDDIRNSTIKEICYWLGHFHDLGKYSDFFQKYIKEDRNSRLKNHAHISACFTYSFLSDYLENNKLDDNIKRNLLFLCYLCVRLHHTSLKVDVSLFPDNMWEDLDILREHLMAKDMEILKDMSLQKEIGVEEFCKYLDINALRKNRRNFELMPTQYRTGRISDHKWYFVLIYMFSILIDMDKLDSATVKPKKVTAVSPDKVLSYLGRKNKGKSVVSLDNRREKARCTIMQVINDLSDDEIKNTHFFTLTAPTGIGKTLSSLQCALRLQERIQEVEKYTPRVITAIPFINIIEQNKTEYQNVCGKEARVIVHHRLSDFSSGGFNTSEDISVDKSLLGVESWEGDIILTTFVQLFQSMLTGKNKPLKKINKLAGSIVILDEAQAVPEKYMPLVGATLKMFSRYYGTRFILMTATQPKLLEFGDMLLSEQGINEINDKVISLLPNHEEYFKDLTRTKLVPLLDKELDTEGFVNSLFFEKWDKEKSCVVIVNTIRRSIDLYNKIKEKLRQKNIDVPIYYLSTNIIPIKRKQVIEEVGYLLENSRPVILISTQTIEAGVDLDFDMGFRDFAPIDAIIQAAGRVNREGKKGDFAPVYITEFESDNDYIYGLLHRTSTRELLMEKEEIKETEYVDLVEKYYQLALKRGVSPESKKIWEQGIVKLNFDVIEEFQLIKDIGNVYDVFIEKDSDATNIADAYQEALNSKDEYNFDLTKIFPEKLAKKFNNKLNIFERKALLRLISAKMNDYIVSVRIPKSEQDKPLNFKDRGGAESELLWVPHEQMPKYYDDETGFVR